jgi:hAT family C-terminal dimerisation region
VSGNGSDMMNAMLKVAQDLLSAPASQAFVERLFSLCGLLTAGRRNRMDKSLEMQMFLRLNAHMADTATEK